MVVALEHTMDWNLSESRLVEAKYMGFFVENSSYRLWLHRTKTNEPTNYFFFSSLASIGVRKDEAEEKLGMRTILGRSNTAQHRHTPVDIVLLGAPKSAGGLPRLCMQYGVCKNDPLDK